LGPPGQGRPRIGKDLGEVEVSEWWKIAPDRGRFRDGGSSGMEGSSGWRMTSGRLDVAKALSG